MLPSLPLALLAKLGAKRALLIGLTVLVLIFGIVLALLGQGQSLLRFLGAIAIGRRQVQIDKIGAQVKAIEGQAGADEKQIAALRDQQAMLVKENAAENLRITGLTHDQVVAELSARGF